MQPPQTPTTAQPSPTPASLRAQMEAVQASLNDALARRAGIIARIDAAGGPGERVRLRNGELAGVDGQIGRLRGELAGLQAELEQREAIEASKAIEASEATPPFEPAAAPPVPPTAITTVPPSTGIDLNSMVLGGIAAVIVLIPLLFAIAWRAGRRAALAIRSPEWEEVGARLARMEEAIATTALEVERVEEGQRFLTSALVAEARQTPVREEVGTRR